MRKKSFTNGLIVGSIIVAVAGVIGYNFFFPYCKQQNNLSEVGHIKEVVLQLIKDEPEKFVDAMNEGSKKQQEALKQQIVLDAQQNSEVLLKTGFTFGDEKANVKLLAFIDPICPHSNTFIKMAFKLLEVGHKIRVQLITTSILGEPSIAIGKLLLAANIQGTEKLKKFWGKLINSNGEVTQVQINQLAKESDLNLETLHKDVNSNQVIEILKSNGDLLEKLKILGVPMVFIFNTNNKIKLLPPLDMNELIEEVKNADKVGSAAP